MIFQILSGGGGGSVIQVLTRSYINSLIWMLSLNFVICTICVQASQSMDPTESQVPSMEEHGLQSELPVVEIEAIDDGLQGEVIPLHNDLFDCMCMPM